MPIHKNNLSTASFGLSVDRNSWREPFAAALALAVVMGFGRFAFTGMYPLMVQEGVMSVSTGSLSASANYAGYLAGALLAAKIPPSATGTWTRTALVATVLCMLALALPISASAFIGLRFAAGVASAIGLVCASIWLLNVVGRHNGAPIFFSGVGTGIAVSAELIAAGNLAGANSGSLWIALASGAMALALFAWYPIRSTQSKVANRRATAGPVDTRHIVGAWPLIVCNGLAGLGYIITATYLPLLIHDALRDVNPLQIWAMFGLAAIPSCFVWHAVHVRLGTQRAMQWNLALQAIGVALPVFRHSAVAYVGSAILVGGTFVGTVTITLPAARHVAGVVRFNLVAAMTASYGVGQIVGPLMTSALMAHGNSFNASMKIAAGALILAAAICQIRSPRPRKEGIS
ncbi:YbfB/YjiJ family MFS transporter [Ralstonia wenshanensis]|uniref:YbfB/YjiJ family MFS transporter n=1 Tax=Ralstonia wenshanensis TaxID=2842456 RepID=UPI002AAD59EE|nr:YbfB/YjiJ family MFS transporter [Ralstonia wenshanensis]MDY7511232.1 YbfB/YjiJ family MFS transporter [Ralstonia wenshanensis]